MVPDQPFASRFPAASLFADISGFTRLSEAFARRGADGVERFSVTISDYLGAMIDTVHAFGGDVENLYGDGILAFWTGPDHAGAAASAHACAQRITAFQDHYVIEPGLALRLRCAVAFGPVWALSAGGHQARLLLTLGGPSLLELGPLLDGAGQGTVVVSGDARALLMSGDARTLVDRRAGGPASRERGPEPAFDPAMLRRFVPASVEHQAHDSWQAEFRDLTILCIGLAAPETWDTAGIGRFQAGIRLVQRVLAPFEACLVRLSMNDKGPMLVAAFGVLGSVHDDDPPRALRAALTVMRDAGGPARVRRCVVTTGPGFCASAGNADRRAFTTDGAVMNRAAKLLHAAALGTGGATVICDAATMRVVDPADILFTAHGISPVGGENMAVFEAAFPPEGMPAITVPQDPIHAPELERLIALSRGTGPRVVFVEGGPGAGKFALCGAFRARIPNATRLLHGIADPMVANELVPTTVDHGIWRPIFEALYAHEAGEGPDVLNATVRDLLQASGLDPGHAGFAASVLPLPRDVFAPKGDASAGGASAGRVPPGGVSAAGVSAAGLEPDDAAHARRDVLLTLLRARLPDRAIVILENTHWMDDPSWALTAAVARALPGVFLLLTARPPDPDAEANLARIGAVTPVERLILRPMDRPGLGALARATLGVGDVDAGLLDAIETRAGGNPLFASQLLLALRDDGAIGLTANGGIARLNPAFAPAALDRLPDTLRRALIARFDRLPDSLRVILKAASIAGQRFPAAVLDAVLGSQAAFDRNLAMLRGLGMIERGAEEVAFEHPLMREVVHGLIPPGQRRDLHGAVARAIEAAGSGDPAVLGHHWFQAGQMQRALPPLSRAGYAALANGAFRAAIGLLRQALTAGDHLPLVHRAELHRCLAEAYLQAGEPIAARDTFLAALEAFGQIWPVGTIPVRARLTREIARQMRHAATGFRGQPEIPAAARAIARAYEGLGQCFGHLSDVDGMVLCATTTMNLASRTGDAPVYSRAAGYLALICELLRLPRLARWYLKRAGATRPGTGQAHDHLMTREYVALYLLAAARLPEAEAELRAMMDLAAVTGERRRWLDASSLLTLTLMAMGRDGECEPVLDALADRLAGERDPQLIAWEALERASLALRRGDLVAADRALTGLDGAIPDTCHDRVWAYGLRARTADLLGRREAALADALAVSDLIADWRRVAFYACDGVFGAAEVILDRLVEDPGLSGAARRMMRRLAAFSLRVPLARPRALALLGRHAAMRGRVGKASRLALRGAEEARVQGRVREREYALAVARDSAASPRRLARFWMLAARGR